MSAVMSRGGDVLIAGENVSALIHLITVHSVHFMIDTTSNIVAIKFVHRKLSPKILRSN